MKKKILFFINSFTGGGAERVCLNLADELHREGHEQIEFIVLNRNDNSYVAPEYIDIYSLNIVSSMSKVKKLVYIFLKLPRLNKHLKENDYELITAHLPFSHIIASLTCLKRKTLYVIHGPQWPQKRRHPALYTLILKCFFRKKCVITVSDGVRSEMIKEYNLSPKLVRRIYNPVPIDELVSMAKLPTPHPRPYIVYVGRLTPPKKPETVIDLFFQGEFYRKYDLVILGEGELRGNVEKKIHDYKIEKYVFLMGFQKDPFIWIQNARLMITVSAWEALPMNIIESLACGTGVVAANCKYGPNEILTGDLAKFLIDPDKNIEESIKIMKNALDNYPSILPQRLDMFRPERIIQQYIDAFHELIENNQNWHLD